MTFEEKHNKLLEYFGIGDEDIKNLFYYGVKKYCNKAGLTHLFDKLNTSPGMYREAIWSKSNEYILFTHLLYKKIFG